MTQDKLQEAKVWHKGLIALLEPRLMFDAAVVPTVVEVVESTEPGAAEEATPEASDESSLPSGQELTNALESEESATEEDTDPELLESTETDAMASMETSDEEGLITEETEGETTTEIAVVDTSIEDYQDLVNLAENAGMEVIEIDGDSDGFESLAEALEGRDDIDALHILSHGDTGEVTLGDDLLTTETLEEHSEALATIAGSLSEDGDILLYGCRVAGEGSGLDFVEELALITGADIAASDDLTGNSELGGDWELEVTTGDIEATLPFNETALSDFSDILAYSGTIDFGTYVDVGGSNGGTGLNNASFTAGAYTLVVDGESADTYAAAILGASYSYVMFGYNGSAEKPETKLTLSFTGGETFDATSLWIYNWSGSTDTFTIYSDQGDSYSVGAINNYASRTANFNFNGISKLYVTSDDGNFMGNIDSLTVSLTPTSSDPAITSATYDASNGIMIVTGENFEALDGATNDVDASDLTLTLEGGATHTLTNTQDVEIDSATQFTLTLSAADKAAVNLLANEDGASSTGGTTYDLNGAAGFIANQATAFDTDANEIIVSNVATPTITSSTYDASSNTLVVTGTDFLTLSGAANDIDISKLTFTGEDGATYTLTSASDVEVDSGTQFSVTLSGTDLTQVESLLNKDGTSADSGTTYNLSAAEDWAKGAAAAVNVIDATSNGITVSNYAVPTVTSATYDYNSNTLVVTGSNFVNNSGATNDVDVSQLVFTGEGGSQYQLTSSSNVEISSNSSYTVTLSGDDLTNVEGLLNKNGTTSATAGTTFNLSSLDDWMTGSPSNSDIADAVAGITVSNYASSLITSAAYDYNTNTLVVTGSNFVSKAGNTNDVDVSAFTFTGEVGSTYTITSATDVDIDSATQFTVALSGADIVNVESLLNKDGTASATSSTTYNLAAADNWLAQAPAGTDISDTTNAITVSNFANPTITSTTYDFSTGVLVLTGSNFVALAGGTNDIEAARLTFTGEGGSTYTLTDSSDVEITSDSSATLTLSSTDRLAVNGLLNKDGTNSATAGTIYNLAAADNWVAGSPAGNSIADATAGVIMSNYAGPTITSATYDYSTNMLVVTGTNFISKLGGSNDIDISTLTLTGEGGSTYTLTSATDVEISSATSFSVTLSDNDLTGVEGLFNKDGTSADSGTVYNLAAADNWLPQAPNGTDINDLTGNGVIVSNYTSPAITNAAYDWASGQLILTGTNFVGQSGATNDIDVSLFTITGDDGVAYTLTDSADVEITSSTSATVTLSASDQLNVQGLLNRDGMTAASGTTYNLSAAEDWMTGSPLSTNVADAGNSITVSNVAIPTVTNATYNSDTGELQVTGTNLFKNDGPGNDIDISLITLTGGTGDATYTLTSSSDVEISSATSFSVTLTGIDKTSVDALLDQIGTASSGGSTYNIAVADNWLTGANPTTNIADASNAVAVSLSPTITSATYDASTGSLVVTGTNIQANGGNLDIDASKITLTGEGGATYTLDNTTDVDRDSATQFTLSLNLTDQTALNQIMNKDGLTSTGGTTFNVAVADDWNTSITAGDTSDTASNAVTVSNVPTPAITSASYDAATGTLVVTGTNFLALTGAANDIDVSKLTFTAEGETYTLTDSSDVEISSGSEFTVTLSATDKAALITIVNKSGTASTDGIAYNLAGSEDWASGADGSVVVEDIFGNGITVSNVAAPTISSSTYDAITGVLVVTGSGFLKMDGGADIDVSKLTFTAEGHTYTLNDSSDVEITSATQFTVTLSATDQGALNTIVNKDGTASTDGIAYNLAAAEDWAAGADVSVNVADGIASITASNVAIPTINSSTYNATTGVLVVTGSGFLKMDGGADIDVSKLTFSAEGQTYTLTNSSDVEITSATQFTVTLSATDQGALGTIVNKDGTASTDGVAYNLAGADDWATGADASVNVADSIASITVSDVAVPTISSSTYNATTGVLVVTGSNFFVKSGGGNDIDVSKFTFIAEGETYTLTDSSDVEITSATKFTVTLSTTDKEALNTIVNKDGLNSTDGIAYNLTAAEDWAAGTDASLDVFDGTNSISVTEVAVPTIDSATYNSGTGVLVVTGTNLVKSAGTLNDVDISTITLTGGTGDATYTLTSSSDVEISSTTSFSVTLSGADKAGVDALLDKNGPKSNDGSTYNIAVAEDWLIGVDPTANIADAINAVTVSMPSSVNTAPDVSTSLTSPVETGPAEPTYLAPPESPQTILPNPLNVPLSGDSPIDPSFTREPEWKVKTTPQSGLNFDSLEDAEKASEGEDQPQKNSRITVRVDDTGELVFEGDQDLILHGDLVLKSLEIDNKTGFLTLVVQSSSVSDSPNFMVTSGNGSPLPSWLSIDPTTGIITGQPPAGTENIVIKIFGTDEKGKTIMLEVEIFFEGYLGEGQSQPVGIGQSVEATTHPCITGLLPLSEQLAEIDVAPSSYGKNLMTALQ